MSEEADESEYWPEVIRDAQLSSELHQLNRLIQEAREIIRLVSKAKITVYNGQQGLPSPKPTKS